MENPTAKLTENLRWRTARFGSPRKIELHLFGILGQDPTLEVHVQFPSPSAQAGMGGGMHCIGSFETAGPDLIREVTQWAGKKGLGAVATRESYRFPEQDDVKGPVGEVLGSRLEVAKRRFPSIPVTVLDVSEDHLHRHHSHTISVGVMVGTIRGVAISLGTFDTDRRLEVREWAEKTATVLRVPCRFSESAD